MIARLLAFSLFFASTSLASAESSGTPSTKPNESRNCECPGPGCPVGRDAAAECASLLFGEKSGSAEKSCPAECERLPIFVGDSTCPCPGPGCPAGGWFANDAINTNPDVARCYHKAEKKRQQNVAECRQAGRCVGESKSSKKSSEKSKRADYPSATDKECPCPGPGCPAGGWFANDAINANPNVAHCYRKAVERQGQDEKRGEETRLRLEKARRAISKMGDFPNK